MARLVYHTFAFFTTITFTFSKQNRDVLASLSFVFNGRGDPSPTDISDYSISVVIPIPFTEVLRGFKGELLQEFPLNNLIYD
ncbi:MAG: hypothetical protein IJ519_02945 [Clostridia bacterium]|nr:hypothetical protein [Clostridia bacterium]